MRNRGYIYRIMLWTITMVFMSACSDVTNIKGVSGKEEPLKGSIEIWCSAEMKETIEHSAELFIEKNPELAIKVTGITYDKVIESLSAGWLNEASYPDLLEINTSKIPYLVQKYPELFLDLDSEVKKIGDKFLPWKLQEVTWEKKIYAFPWNADPQVMLYNKELADTYNINPSDIRTWNDFQDVGEILNKKTEGKIKLIALRESGTGNLYKSMMRQLSTGLYKNDGAIGIPEDETKKVLNQIKKLFDKDTIYEIKDTEDHLTALKNGAALSIIADGRDIKKINESQELNKIQWQVERFPAFENGGKNTACGEGNAIMAVKRPSQSEAALKFVRFMLTDSEANTFALKNSAIIGSAAELYSLPLFNQVADNYKGMKVWRFMAESEREETAITYDTIYDKMSRELIQLEQDFLRGKDLTELIRSKEQELNRP